MEEKIKYRYRNLIGALLFIVKEVGQMFHLMLITLYLGRSQSCYNKPMFCYLLQVLIYRYNIRHLKLTCKPTEFHSGVVDCYVLDCCVDLNWAADLVDARFTTRFVLRVFGFSVS